MVLISSVPKDRAGLSIEVLNSGKDVMVDKPGCTTLDQLEDLKRTVKKNRKNLVGKFFRTISCCSNC